MKNDPAVGPDPSQWLEAGERERLEAVRQYHGRAKDLAGGPETHAGVHCAVETQLAEGHVAARAALERLLRDGLDRHDAVHAIGSVVAAEIFEVLRSKRPHDPKAYARKLDALTASKWRNGSSG